MDLSIETATSIEEVETMLAFAKREGWNLDMPDAHTWLAFDPRGFFVGRIDGRIVTTISAVSYAYKNDDDDEQERPRRKYGFIGFFIVDPAHRGSGYGYRMFTHAMEHLKSTGCEAIALG